MPDTRYARLGEDHIAFQTIGDGPRDIVFMSAWFSHVDGRWEEPRFAAMLRRLSSLGRLPRTRLRELGIEIRMGLHTGEIEIREHEIAGIAIVIAARLMAEAGASEIIASSTVKDLVTGSDVSFVDRGMHALKGVPNEWRLYAVA